MRKPRPITSTRLANIARHYLERYVTSSSHLRDLLRERVRKEAHALSVEPEQWYPLVDDEIAKLLAAGALDDERYASDRARSLFRRGSSQPRIRAGLRSKGLSSEIIDTAIEHLHEEQQEEGVEEPDLVAACTYARKRRLGPWRTGSVDDEGRQRELAKLVRAGFPWSVARRVVDAPDIDALEVM
jgi:regulatory protein